MRSTPTAHTNHSCQRCYRRKKRCDRTLPQCRACEQAHASCSFLDQNNEVGSFSISYVRGLERRVSQLEEQLRVVLGPASSTGNAEQTPNVDGSAVQMAEPSSSLPGDDPSSRSKADGPSIRQDGPSHPEDTTDSLASELKMLSLEAAAERYLGSSSGVSFARLTQAVLKRLGPDQYSFAAENGTGENFTLHKDGQFSPSSPTVEEGLSSSSQPQTATPPAPPPLMTGELSSLAVPTQEHARHLADFYWSHTHTLYPMVRRDIFMDCLDRVYSYPNDPLMQTPSWLFRMWMVFAIGSTTYSSVTLFEETESVMFFNRAMSFFEDTLAGGNMVALEALLLQIAYSFFNQVGPNTWFLVGVAVRIAIGMGLHTEAPKDGRGVLPVDVQEHRRRLFFSLYMMDRVVSVALGRPFAIRDCDIEIEPFADVDDENIKADRIIPRNPLKPSSIAVPLHILSLRRIASEIFEHVYSNNRKRDLEPAQRDDIIAGLHRKLIEWRKNMPFPLPGLQALRVPHLSTAWFDLNYYNHIIMLYRPSPLCPTLNLEKVRLLAEASAMSIQQASIMHRQQRFAFNWLNLFGVFASTLALIYSITAQPDDLSTFLQHSGAHANLEIAVDLLGAFGKKFPSALKCQAMVQGVARRLQSYLPQNSDSGQDADRTESFPTRLMSHGGEQISQSSRSPQTSQNTLSYPSYPTGNRSYDDLQSQIQNDTEDLHPVPGQGKTYFQPLVPSESSPSPFAQMFQLPPTASLFGDFARQLSATESYQTGGMDVDEDFMNFLQDINGTDTFLENE